MEPVLLLLQVGSSQPLTRPLHGKPQAMQHPGDMMVVVAHADLFMDEVADHGPGPDARAVPGRHGPCLDHGISVCC